MPVLVTLKLLPTVAVPKVNALASVIVTTLLPLLLSDTAPPKLLLLPYALKLIVAPPAVKLDVPVMVNAAA